MADWPDAAWLKSTYCESGNCIEIAVLDDQVAIRDSDRNGPVLMVTREEWQAFLNGARSGEFDLS
jgi:uncharacterized protein DUF397